MTFKEFIDFTESVRGGVREIVLKHYGTDQIEYKADESPVTVADREIEVYLTNAIGVKFPTHSIVGEEGASKQGTEDWQWVIDPIDGTKSFIHQVPLFTTLLGVIHGGVAQYGMIYNPVLDEMTVGDNFRAYHNGRVCRVRRCERLEDATLVSSDLQSFSELRDGEKFHALASRCRVVRSWGDGNGYQMLATGRADIMVDAKMSLWDIAGVAPVVRGAGGVVQGLDGELAEKAHSLVGTTHELLRYINI